MQMITCYLKRYWLVIQILILVPKVEPANSTTSTLVTTTPSEGPTFAEIWSRIPQKVLVRILKKSRKTVEIDFDFFSLISRGKNFFFKNSLIGLRSHSLCPRPMRLVQNDCTYCK